MRKAVIQQRVVDAVEGFNEPSQWNHQNQAEFEIRLVDKLSPHGIQYVAFDWSVGNPRLEHNGDPDGSVWRDPIVIEACRKAPYLGLHEYCADRMNSEFIHHPEIDENVGGFYTLRYRFVHEQLSESLAPEEMPIFLITETGIDGGITPDWSFPGHGGGWAGFVTEDEFMDDLGWYDGHMQRDSYVRGATIFTHQSRSLHKWGTFDTDKPDGMRNKLAGYISDSHDVPDSEVPAGWIDLRSSLMKHTTERYDTRSLSQVDTLAFHHTDGHEADWPTERLAYYHVVHRNFAEIGYHITLGTQGEKYFCVDLEKISAGIAGHNDNTIHIAFLSRLRGETEPTPQQLAAAMQIQEDLRSIVPYTWVVGHKDIADTPTRCPGDNWDVYKHKMILEDDTSEEDRLRGLLAQEEALAIEMQRIARER